jgi:hypothetical protein
MGITPVDQAPQVDDHQVPAFPRGMVFLQLSFRHPCCCIWVDGLFSFADLKYGVVPNFAPSPDLCLQKSIIRQRGKLKLFMHVSVQQPAAAYPVLC